MDDDATSGFGLAFLREEGVRFAYDPNRVGPYPDPPVPSRLARITLPTRCWIAERLEMLADYICIQRWEGL